VTNPATNRQLRSKFAKPIIMIISCLATAALWGCHSQRKYPGAHLAGSVSIDGQPVEDGSIAFTPSGSAKGPAVGAKITAGHYDCPYVPLGDSLVQIYALRPTGKMIEVMGSMRPEMEDLVPKKDRDGIKIEISGDNLNQNFALNSSDGAR
jgi:hypothetical protein